VYLKFFSLTILVGSLLFPSDAIAQRDPVEDTEFKVIVKNPAYPEGKGPIVLLDEAHHNIHSLVGFYRPFGEMLRSDGYQVGTLREPITAAALKGASVVVISNALPAPSPEESDKLGSAFTKAEMDALIRWIRSGGGLLLFVDHRPFPRAAAALGKMLGVEMLDGYALDYEVWGPIVFSRLRGTLLPHPITDGRSQDERIESVATFYGHAMRGTSKAIRPIMVFGPEIESMHPMGLWEIGDDTPRIAVGGWMQGAVRTLGRGRVVIYGEAGMAVAQRAGPRSQPVGMNTKAGAQNPQMLINTVRWLSKILPEK
jgi:hypothetical protein